MKKGKKGGCDLRRRSVVCKGASRVVLCTGAGTVPKRSTGTARGCRDCCFLPGRVRCVPDLTQSRPSFISHPPSLPTTKTMCGVVIRVPRSPLALSVRLRLAPRAGVPPSIAHPLRESPNLRPVGGLQSTHLARARERPPAGRAPSDAAPPEPSHPSAPPKSRAAPKPRGAFSPVRHVFGLIQTPQDATGTPLTPMPCSSIPEPYNPKADNRKPEPLTLHLTPYTLHPKPSTLNPKILSPKP